MRRKRRVVVMVVGLVRRRWRVAVVVVRRVVRRRLLHTWVRRLMEGTLGESINYCINNCKPRGGGRGEAYQSLPGSRGANVVVIIPHVVVVRLKDKQV